MEALTNTFSNLLAFVFALGVIIFVHEAGHMLVAKAFGVRVLTFSLGFGKRLWGFRRGDTEYRLSLIPLGGYVKMSGELPDEGGDDPADFLNKPRWQRFLVYLAGPAMNAVLAVALIAAVFMMGISVPAVSDIAARVGSVQEGSSADLAGIQAGDEILSVDDEPVVKWDRVQLLLMTAQGKEVTLRLRRGSEELTVTVLPQKIPDFHLYDTAGILQEELLSVTQLSEGKPAQAAGFQIGDRLVSMGGRPVVRYEEFIKFVSSHPGQPIHIVVRRDGKEVEIAVTPEDLGGTGKIGLAAGLYQKYGPVQAVVQSVRHNVQIVEQTFFVLGKIFTRRIAAESALSGPIEIAKYSGEAARIGFRYLLYLMGVISISIGILNLLPIPVLDGGQMVILGVESVMRRDLSIRLKEAFNQVGFVLILLIMLTVIFFDVKKNIPGL